MGSSKFSIVKAMAGLGKDSENLSINMPKLLVKKLEELATADKRTKSNYCRKILEEHVVQMQLQEKGKQIQATSIPKK